MRERNQLSRRSVIAGLTATPMLSTSTESEAHAPDARLMALGREFDKLSAQWDGATTDAVLGQDFFERFGYIEREIVAVDAKTNLGMLVKARAACWARLGDLDPINEEN